MYAHCGACAGKIFSRCVTAKIRSRSAVEKPHPLLSRRPSDTCRCESRNRCACLQHERLKALPKKAGNSRSSLDAASTMSWESRRPARCRTGLKPEPLEKARCHVVALKPDLCSLDVRSMSFGESVFMNTPTHLLEMAKSIRDYGIKLDIEVFDLGHIALAKHFLPFRRNELFHGALQQRVFRQAFAILVMKGRFEFSRATPALLTLPWARIGAR